MNRVMPMRRATHRTSQMMTPRGMEETTRNGVQTEGLTVDKMGNLQTDKVLPETMTGVRLEVARDINTGVLEEMTNHNQRRLRLRQRSFRGRG